MEYLGYYNGEFAPLEELKIPALDRAVYFGDGVYEFLYCRNKKPFAIREHMARLEKSLALMKIDPPMPFASIEDVIHECLKRVEGSENGVYLQVSRGTYYRKHAFPPAGTKSNLLLFATPFTLRDISAPLKLRTEPDMRWLRCDIKSLNLAMNILASEAAVQEGCAETIFHKDGYVTENATSNLFIIKDGALKTAPLSGELLAGVTRNHVVELSKACGIPVIEEAFTLEEMFSADEVIMASTSTHCGRVSIIDDRPVGLKDPKTANRLQAAYRKKLLEGTR
ncbi:aminotransferase class IV [Christensenellaceae bacterium OttesenSCG-928-M15]|nr:aminotransferase class IV [Christensenellaceae bacterium OttesenSCG-928-M15]